MANTNDGWIKIWRKLADSQMWLEKPFSKGQAWIDLLLLATSADHISKYRGKTKNYKSGTVYFSLCFLTERWGWSRNKVYRFINKLQNDGMIEYQGRTSNGTMSRTQNGTINDTTNGTTNDTFLTIVNWALYQGKQSKDGTINGTINDTGNGTTKRTSNGTHPKNDIHKKDISKEDNVAPLIPFPCGVAVKPEWMDEDLWNDVRFRKVEDIPTLLQGDFDTYIEYAEEAHRRGEEIR